MSLPSYIGLALLVIVLIAMSSPAGVTEVGKQADKIMATAGVPDDLRGITPDSKPQKGKSKKDEKSMVDDPTMPRETLILKTKEVADANSALEQEADASKPSPDSSLLIIRSEEIKPVVGKK